MAFSEPYDVWADLRQRGANCVATSSAYPLTVNVIVVAMFMPPGAPVVVFRLERHSAADRCTPF